MALRTFKNYWRPSHYHRFDEDHFNSIFRKKSKKTNDNQCEQSNKTSYPGQKTSYNYQTNN